MVTATRTTCCLCVRMQPVSIAPSTWPSRARQRYIMHTVTRRLCPCLFDWQPVFQQHLFLLHLFSASIWMLPFHRPPICESASAGLSIQLVVLHSSGHSQYCLDRYWLLQGAKNNGSHDCYWPSLITAVYTLKQSFFVVNICVTVKKLPYFYSTCQKSLKVTYETTKMKNNNNQVKQNLSAFHSRSRCHICMFPFFPVFYFLWHVLPVAFHGLEARPTVLQCLSPAR